MIRFFAAHPTAGNLLMILFFAAGIFSVPSLRRETFPDYTADEVEITVSYPGATAEDIEDAVCRRIEEAVDGVNDVEEIRSEAVEGMGKVVVRMQEGKDFPTFINDIKTEVEAVDEFPIETEDPIVKEVGLTEHVVSVAVTGPMPADAPSVLEPERFTGAFADLHLRWDHTPQRRLSALQSFFPLRSFCLRVSGAVAPSAPAANPRVPPVSPIKGETKPGRSPAQCSVASLVSCAARSTA